MHTIQRMPIVRAGDLIKWERCETTNGAKWKRRCKGSGQGHKPNVTSHIWLFTSHLADTSRISGGEITRVILWDKRHVCLSILWPFNISMITPRTQHILFPFSHLEAISYKTDILIYSTWWRPSFSVSHNIISRSSKRIKNRCIVDALNRLLYDLSPRVGPPCMLTYSLLQGFGEFVSPYLVFCSVC